ncbi:hypothetical protein Hanom_Chr16g01426771 [Helianthus anomalus]
MLCKFASNNPPHKHSIFFKLGFCVQMQIVIISNEDEKKQLTREVGEDVLPEEFGGHAKLVLLQDVVLPPLEGSP